MNLKNPKKEKMCTKCRKTFPTLCKTRIKDSKKESFCFICWPKIKAIENKEKVKIRKKIQRERRRLTLPYLTKQLDIVFSKFIRLRDADSEGMCKCIDCSLKSYWKNTDCGHFASRRCMSTRWHENNCAAQHKACNGPIGLGRQYEFGKGLDQKFGPGTADKMMELSRKEKKWTSQELLELIEHYENKIKEFEYKI